jgi:hypothetical protein
MINFVVITDTPARLRDFLIARNIIKEVDGNLTGVLPGMEWVRVPNVIQTAPGSGTPGEVGYVSPTYDDRAVFLVKFAHESQDNDFDTDAAVESPLTVMDHWDLSKFAKWVRNNSSVVNAPANYLINGEPAGKAFKVTGEQVWLVRDGAERFGVWQ